MIGYGEVNANGLHGAVYFLPAKWEEVVRVGRHVHRVGIDLHFGKILNIHHLIKESI